jgi:hypothetical protein
LCGFAGEWRDVKRVIDDALLGAYTIHIALPPAVHWNMPKQA